MEKPFLQYKNFSKIIQIGFDFFFSFFTLQVSFNIRKCIKFYTWKDEVFLEYRILQEKVWLRGWYRKNYILWKKIEKDFSMLCNIENGWKMKYVFAFLISAHNVTRRISIFQYVLKFNFQ